MGTQYLIDEQGNRTGVVLDLATYENLLERVVVQDRDVAEQNIETSDQPSGEAVRWNTPHTSEAITLLRSWRSGDADEQRATLEALKIGLDEDRLSDRPLFP